MIRHLSYKAEMRTWIKRREQQFGEWLDRQPLVISLPVELLLILFALLCFAGVVVAIGLAAHSAVTMAEQRGSVVRAVPAKVIDRAYQESYETRQFVGIAGKGGHEEWVRHPREWVLIVKADCCQATDVEVGAGVFYGVNVGDTVMLTEREWPDHFEALRVELLR